MPKHISQPRHTRTEPYLTGQPPLARGATDIAEHARWLLNWIGNRQIFTFAGPGPVDRELVSSSYPYTQINPDYDFDGDPYFAIVTRSQELHNVGHQLAAKLYTWRHVSGATVSWTPSGGSETTLWTATADSQRFDTTTMVEEATNRIDLYKDLMDPGVAGGGFAVHRLAYSDLMAAGLGIWTMPDRTLTHDWRLWSLVEFMVGRKVRGDLGETAHMGLGQLIGAVAELLYRNGRCLIGSGHPAGVCTSSTSYVNLRGGASHYMVQPINLYQETTVTCTPVIVAQAVGASVGTPANVRVSSSVAADSYEFDITSDTEAMYTAPGELEINGARDFVKFEIKAPTDGAVAIRSYYLWEDIGSV